MAQKKFNKPDFINLDNSIRFYTGNISSEKNLGAYYQDTTAAIKNFETEQFGPFDMKGLPMCGFADDAFYNSIYIIQYGIIHHDLFLKNGDNNSKQKMILSCNWLIENAVSFHDSVCWPSPKANKKYNLPAGWNSAMYQGQAISLLLRAYQMCGTESYLHTSQKAFLFFNYSFEEGGVTVIDQQGNLWLEEYPSKPASHVLNGFIYAWLGVYDYWRVFKTTESKTILDACLKTMKENLHHYHLWYWSVYDKQKKELVSAYYMINIHVNLLDILFQLTHEKIFERYALLWKNSYHSTFKRMLVPLMLRVKPRLQKWFGV